MRLFEATLDPCLDSPFLASLSVHGLHLTVYAPSNFLNLAAQSSHRKIAVGAVPASGLAAILLQKFGRQKCNNWRATWFGLFPCFSLYSLFELKPPNCKRSPGGNFSEKSLRAKGALSSEPRFSIPCEMRFFPSEKGKTAFSKQSPRQRPFPFLAWEKSHLAGGRKSGLTN